MSLRTLIAYPMAAALALSPIMAHAQALSVPSRAAAQLQQANGQDDDSTAPEGYIAITIVVTVIVFLALVVFDEEDDPLPLPPSSP